VVKDCATFYIISKRDIDTYRIVGIQVYKFMREVKQFCRGGGGTTPKKRSESKMNKLTVRNKAKQSNTCLMHERDVYFTVCFPKLHQSSYVDR